MTPLLLDEMLSPVVAEQLRRRGHDVVAVGARSDLRKQPDSVVFSAAQAERRALVTANVRDFVRIAQRFRGHCGLVYVPSRIPRRDPIGHLVRALDALLTAEIDLDSREYWLP